MDISNRTQKSTSAHGPGLINLCSKAVNLSNNISTHLDDYVESPAGRNDTTRSFATKFQRLREMLSKIQAGLSHVSHMDMFVPYRTSQELLTRLESTIQDLISSDLLVVKLVTNARKKGLGKFLDGLKRASLETEVMIQGDAMSRHYEALKVGWTSFNKMFGEIDQSLSMAHASNTISKKSSDFSQPTLNHAASHISTRSISAGDTNMSTPNIRRNSQLDLSTVFHYPTQAFNSQETPPHHVSAPQPASITSSSQPDEPHTPLSVERDWAKANVWAGSKSVRHDNNGFSRSSSFRIATAPSQFEANPTASPESQVIWTNTSSATDKTALIAALQRRDHKSLQQLLRGATDGDCIPLSLLSRAVKGNDTVSVRLLLTYGAPVNHIDDDGNSPLLFAVATSSTDMAEILLEYGADPNLESSGSGISPFTLAARQSQVRLVHLMLDHGADVNAMSSTGDVPLNACICHGVRTEIVLLLLAAGANPNGKTQDGKTPLFEALSMRRLDIVTCLLDHGANPNLAGPKHPLWPATYLPSALKLLISRGAKSQMAPGNMELAASINSIQSVLILLEAGVSPNVKKDGVYTPLCSAIRDDRADIVTLLLSRGADPNLPASEYPAWKCISHDRLHFLPSIVAAGANLHSPPGIAEIAVSSNNKEALMYLLLNGVDVNARNEDERSALTTAIKNDHTEFVEILLTHGASVTLRGEDWPLCMALKKPTLLKRLLEHVQNPHGVTKGIIELAVQADQLESIKLLVEAGISVEDRTGGVFSPLTSAIREHRVHLVRYLLDEAGADVNAPGEHLPLVKAIRRCTDHNDTEIIEMLLERGADINLLYRGWNAIMQAVEKGNKKLIQLLIEKGNGIDLQVVDSDSGQTVYEMIHDRGWSDGIDLLVQHR